MGRLDGKVALISGGARGMGATEARMFTEEGASVIFGDVLDELGAQVESQIRELGGESTYLHLDVTNSEDWKRAIGVAESKYGRLDILVNNAGILRRYSIEETTEEVWNEIIAVNATGVFLGTKYAIPVMRRAGGGSIVNISLHVGYGWGRPAGLRCLQGRGAALHQIDRDSVRQGKHPLQFGSPGLGGHSHASDRAG